MTVGNTLDDFRVVTPSASGNGLVGTLYQKTWSGTDYAKSETLEPTSTRGLLNYMVRVNRKEMEMVQEIALPPLPKRPPKRARTEEHPYSMSLRSAYYAIYPARGNPYQSFTPNRYGFDVYMYEPYFLNKWDTNDDLKLIGKLREAVAGSDFNLGVALGESKEAMAMVLDSALRIRQAYTAARQGRFDRARNFLVSGTARKGLGKQETASNWLQLQYGWLPLLNDAKAGAEFLAHQHSYPLQEIVRVARKKEVTVVTNNFGYDFGSKNGYVLKSIKAILKEKDVVALAGLKDPLSIAWELVPYSFVIDWFIPIGSYLSARGLNQSLTGTFVTTTKEYYSGQGIVGLMTEYGPAETQDPASSVRDKVVRLNRVVSTSLDVPMPSVKPLSKVASWQHLTNAVALLVNLKK